MEYDKRRDRFLEKNVENLPALHRGAVTGDLELVKNSVKNGALMNEVICGFTALDRALRYNKEHVVAYLLSIPETKLSTPDQLLPSLATAVQFSTVSIIKRLLDYPRVDINETYGGHCPFLAACSERRADSVELLLNLPPHRRLNKRCANDAGMTPSFYACFHGSMTIICLLIQHDCFDPLCEDTSGRTPLFFACTNCEINVVRLILNLLLESKQLEGVPLIDYLYWLAMHQKAFKSITRILLEYIDIKSNTDKLLELMYSAVCFRKSSIVCILSPTIEPYVNITSIEKLNIILIQARRMITGKDMLHCIFPLWWRAWAQWRGLVRVFNHVVQNGRKKRRRQLLKDGKTAQYKSLRLIYKYGTEAQGTDLTLSMLYFVILDGLTDLVKFIFEIEGGLKSKFFLKLLPDRAITLLNLSTKYDSIHAILVKKFRYRHVLLKAEPYKVWYQKKRWLSSSVDNISKQPTKDVIKLVDEIKVFLTDEEGNSEKQLVISTIKSFLSDVNRIVSKHNPLFQFKPQLVGSSNEGTRPFYPDEYDFIQVMTVLEKHVRVQPESKVETRCRIYPTDKALDDPLIKSSLDNDGQFNFLLFKTMLDLKMFDVFSKLFSSNNRYGSYLYRDLSVYETKHISAVHLRWRGKYYKDMPISVDLVPAIRIRNPPTYTQYTAKPCKYYVFCKGSPQLEEGFMSYPVAFSDVEQTKMNEFSQNARDGFMLSKAIRLSILMDPEIEFSEDVSNLHDCLKTYMLKTCLVRVHERLLQKSVDPEPEQWALLIYQQLLDYLFIGELRPLFASDNEGNVALFSCRHFLFQVLLDKKNRAACCTTRMDIWQIAIQLKAILTQYCQSKNIDPDPVQMLPFAEYLGKGNH